MLVQHDEAGQHALAGQIDDGRASRRRRARGIAERGDAGVADYERLILSRLGAGAVDDPRVYEGDDRRLDFDERRERIG